jgi:tetratricopeptide (TPR) repeat protein
VPLDPATDPCLQIQVDLSAMVDGELDQPSVRRVLVHTDVCPSCSMFLQGIRTQARANVDLHAIFEGRPLAEIDLDVPTVELPADELIGERPSSLAEELRQKLRESRQALARILYELGRGHVLMGTSPKFYRAVGREPVPIPDVCMRGRNLLDEVRRLAPALKSEAAGREWVRAKLLFESHQGRSPAENLGKGIELLREVLLLRPRYHEARIYLGHAYHIRQDRDLARHEFKIVLSDTDDLIMRAFALENLGNVDLEEGCPVRAIPHFLRLLDSGVIAREPRFFTSYFNLALAYGLLREFESSTYWLHRLYTEFPHKRGLMRKELHARVQFAAILAAHPLVTDDLARRFPDWFPLPPQSGPSLESH